MKKLLFISIILLSNLGFMQFVNARTPKKCFCEVACGPRDLKPEDTPCIIDGLCLCAQRDFDIYKNNPRKCHKRGKPTQKAINSVNACKNNPIPCSAYFENGDDNGNGNQDLE